MSCPQAPEYGRKLSEPTCAEFVQPVENSWLKALQEHAVCALDLPICLGVCDGSLIDPDVLFIAESNEFPTGELRAVVCDDGVWYSKAMDDVKEEQHSLLGFDHGDRSSFDPFRKLVYGDK